uniref:MADF domain-containing protein n=1 Tax=Meloidogyne hapla TaxID=6305 RepID=A0A1I8C2N2_MELHA
MDKIPEQPLSTEEKFQLISLIRDKPAIWDAPQGGPRKSRQDEFNSVAEEMSKEYQRIFTAESIRSAWRVLNICFHRERRKAVSKWQYFQEMTFLSNTNNTPKQKRSIDGNPKKKKRVKKEDLTEENENNKNEGFDILKTLGDLNGGNLTTDENPSNLTIRDNEFGNNGGENNNNFNTDEDSGNEGLQIIEDIEADKTEETGKTEELPVNNNDDNNTKSVATAIIHETPNKTIDTAKTCITNILEDMNEDDSLLLGKMVVCTHRALKAEGMECEAVGLEKSILPLFLDELLINYKQMRAEAVKKTSGGVCKDE